MLEKHPVAPSPTHTPSAVDQAEQLHPVLLDKVVAQSLLPTRHTDGIAIGVLEAFDANGKALVSIAAFGLSSLTAASLVALNSAHLGAQLALGFEAGDTQRPIILGLILSAAQPTADSLAVVAPEFKAQSEATHQEDSASDTDHEADHEADQEADDAAETLDLIVDGRHIVLQAEREIELRCGDAAIILSADGHIQLRGTYITSHASATQRILGGSINMN
jgi:hypothetical protein